MEEGIRSHEEEDAREERRSLRHYGVTEGERFFHLSLLSPSLGLTGRIDLVIAAPSKAAPDAEAIVVEYKLSEKKAGPHFALQLAAYALLIEEAWHIPVRKGFLYSIPLRRAEPVPSRRIFDVKSMQTVAQIQQHCRTRIYAASTIIPGPLCHLRIPTLLQRCRLTPRREMSRLLAAISQIVGSKLFLIFGIQDIPGPHTSLPYAWKH